MQQDFSKKISIVINKELPAWQVLNCLANVAAHFGHHLTDNYRTGENFVTKDEVKIPRNTQYPTIVFETDKDGIRSFASKIKDNNSVEKMYFIREMIETTNDDEIQQSVGSKNFNGVEILGVGIFGKNDLLKDLTHKFKLWS